MANADQYADVTEAELAVLDARCGEIKAGIGSLHARMDAIEAVLAIRKQESAMSSP